MVMEIDEDHVAAVMGALTSRLGDLKSEAPLANKRRRFVFVLPSRGLLGFHPTFMATTKGTGKQAAG